MSISSVTQTIFSPNTSATGAAASASAFQLSPLTTSATPGGSATIAAFNPIQSLVADLQSALLGLQDSNSPTGAASAGQSGATQTGSDGSGTNTIAQASGHHHHHHHHGQGDSNTGVDPTQTDTTAATPTSAAQQASPTGA